MKKLLPILAITLIPSAVMAQSCCVLISGSGSSTTGNLNVNSSVCVRSDGLYVSCGGIQPDDNQIAAWAASKAVEGQQAQWWNEKKVSELSRAELEARIIRLNALCKWAETLSNHVFAHAYQQWARDRLVELENRRQTLDNLDVAKSIITGLPTPPVK